MTGSTQRPVAPNLASILQTLSSDASANPEGNKDLTAVQDGQKEPNDARRPIQSDLPDLGGFEEDEYDPESTALTPALPSVDKQTTPASVANAFGSNSYQKPSRRDDPKKITSWSVALRFTTRLLHEAPAVGQRVRALMENQHTNERQWWKGREDLMKMQKARVESREQIQQVLRSIGAAATASNDPSSDGERRAEEEAGEMHAYDLKVHRLMGKMLTEQERDLANLGFPFFGMAAEAKASLPDDEVFNLQRKLVSFLEEFLRE